jgi:hypothetical protein
MFRVRQLRNLLQAGSTGWDRRSSARCRKPVRLMLESLEERLTPSGGNPSVTQTAGSYSTLTAAVAADTAADTNYVIEITNNFTFASGGQVTISKLGTGSTLSLEGQDGTNYTLSGNGNRLFTIGSSQNVTFADLTLTGGSVSNSKVAQGGAILDQGGNVTLSKVIVQGNTVKGGAAEGGGVYISGASILTIRDSILSDDSAQGVQGADGTVPGMNGGAGGSAYGGGLYVLGSGWTVTLIGDTFSGNTAIGGNGGSGAVGSNATAPNTSGGTGGAGGNGGDALGGATYFSVSGNGGRDNLTILNDLSAPLTHPSTMIDNIAQAGTGGEGGAGGDSTGTAFDSGGGGGGFSGTAEGGALYVGSDTGATANVNIGNSAFYANKVATGNDGAIGAHGTGGRFEPPPEASGSSASGPSGPIAAGGGLALADGNITIVNSTIATNTAFNTAVAPFWGGAVSLADTLPSPGLGGGIFDNDAATVILDNNTITQNSVSRGNYYYSSSTSTGAGVLIASGNPTLVNNLIQGNQNTDSSPSDLATSGTALNNASNNFIGTISPNAVSSTANIVGNTRVQLDRVVGIDADGNLTGGPVYYPLLPGVVSIGTGSTIALPTIAAVEGTTAANAVDAIGNPRSNNDGINLGAVQLPPPSPPSPPPSPAPSPAPAALDVPPLLAFFNSLLQGTETVNADGTETITDSFFGIPLIVSTFDSQGNIQDVTLFGFDVTLLFLLL